jgi:hypothetical protein
MSRRVLRSSCLVSEVPPFCVLADGRPLDEAVRIASKAFGLSLPIDILVLGWKLRATAEGHG